MPGAVTELRKCRKSCSCFLQNESRGPGFLAAVVVVALRLNWALSFFSNCSFKLLCVHVSLSRD